MILPTFMAFNLLQKGNQDQLHQQWECAAPETGIPANSSLDEDPKSRKPCKLCEGICQLEVSIFRPNTTPFFSDTLKR